MGCDYVSELQPPTGLLFILHVLYEHGEPWWNDIDKGKFVHQSSLAILPTESVAKQEELAKEKMNFALRNISFILRRVL
jgi:hypothetical protein